MALIKCYECGKEISDKAPICPQCGAPKLIDSKAENIDQLKNLSVIFSKIFRGKFSYKNLKLSEIKFKYSKSLLLIFLGTFVPIGVIVVMGIKESNWDFNVYTWRLLNGSFIESRCKIDSNFKPYDINGSVRKGCKSFINKIANKAKQIPLSTFSYCNRYLVKNLPIYDGTAYEVDYGLCIKKRTRSIDPRLQKIKRQKARREEELRKERYEAQQRELRKKKREDALFKKQMDKIIEKLTSPQQAPKVIIEQKSIECETRYNPGRNSYETDCQ